MLWTQIEKINYYFSFDIILQTDFVFDKFFLVLCIICWIIVYTKLYSKIIYLTLFN